MNLELLDNREKHIVCVVLAFLKRCRLTSEAFKVDLQLTENSLDYKQILGPEIDRILERLGVKY